MNRLIVLTALAGLLAAGCSSNRGGTSDQQGNPGYSTGNETGGPVRGPGTGGMGGTSTAPGGTSSGNGASDTDTQPNTSAAPSIPPNNNQAPQ